MGQGCDGVGARGGAGLEVDGRGEGSRWMGGAELEKER